MAEQLGPQTEARRQKPVAAEVSSAPIPGEATDTGTPGAAIRQLGYVNESDVDLVLVLDAHRRGPLAQALFARVGLPFEGPITAARSTSRNAGNRETDVEIRAGGAVLLVEDKIDAPFTPGQAESYRDAVTELRDGGVAAGAVLVCPQRRIDRYLPSNDDDRFVAMSLEELIEIADAAGDSFSTAAAVVLRAATETRPGPVGDPLIELWGEAYRAAVAAAADEPVTFAKSAFRNAAADWVKVGLAGIPAGVDGPWHQLSAGVVVVYTPVEPRDLPGAASAAPTRKGWRVDVRVPVMTLGEPVESQVDAIGEVVSGACLLRDWSSTQVL